MSPADEEEQLCGCECRCDQFPTWPQVGLYVTVLVFVAVFGSVVAGMFNADCR